MNRALLVLKHEIYALVSRRSFWLFLFGVPALGFAIYGGAAYLNRTPSPAPAQSAPGEQVPFPVEGAPSTAEATQPALAVVEELFAPQEELRPQGVIDQAGLLVNTDDLFYDERVWRFYDAADEADADLRSGVIAAYYVILPDYVNTGRLMAYTAEYNMITTSQSAAALVEAIETNLFGDELRAAYYDMPFTTVEEVNLSPAPQPQRETNSILGLAIPYAVTSLLMMSILGSATLLLNGLAEEKVNRTIETLLLSTTPNQILLGKIGGLGIVGLFQTAVWGGLGFLLLRLSGQTFAFPDAYMLSGAVLAWGALFFLLGYLLYAALMAGVGALVPGLREASQVTFIISLPLMSPYFLLPALAGAPNSWLAVAFSLFPLTAPTGMLLRMSAGDVPLWQAALSALLLAASCALVIRLAARMFRAQTIMAGQKWGVRSVWRAVRGR